MKTQGRATRPPEPEPSYSSAAAIAEPVEDPYIGETIYDIMDDDIHSTPKPLKGKRKMAIDFSKLSTAGAHATTLNFTKAIEVTAGERINFSKTNPGVTKLRVEIYWESDSDGDIAAVTLGADKNATPGGICFHQQLSIAGINHSGDCRGGVDGDASIPEETMTIDLDAVGDLVDSVLIVAGTHPKEGEDQNKAIPFGRLRDCRVLIINDANGYVLYAFELDEDFSTFTSVELASFYRKGGDWRYTNMAEGVGTSVNALVDFQAKYDIK